ncbi:hypothetical protein, partial [Pseudomonas sp. 2822-17]|uniref:hypothetical protein n=1 Tax=Pseudomonas sp. 2822-17 TaxID=1712678 RepID=UPI000C57FD38
EIDEAVYGKGKKRHIPELEILSQHLARKGAVINELKPLLVKQLKDNQQYELFEELEMPLSIVLGKMEMNGISVDKNELTEMGEKLTATLE